ncbi:MAG: HAD family hydrolase [Tractidigestivibacter sp.]|jgi:HAD superfamily hydrolase (TIGR01484 family)|uniref:HAD family hydrolase n=1 Tax=Tractidigestivibacter sp. TaxID=2847320 RepID=UPI003D91998F
MIRLALSDLDDTLIPYGQGRASDAAIAAIRTVNATGVAVAGPISGRTIAMMSWMFEQDAADCFQTGIFVNGQVVRLRGKVIEKKAPSREGLERLVRYLRQTEGEGVALTVYDDMSEDRDFCIGITEEEMARHPKAYHAFHQVSPHIPEGEFVKTNLHCDRPRAYVEKMRDQLVPLFPEFNFIFPSPTSSTLDITPAGVDKMSGLRTLMDAMGVGLDEVCVFGDSENDLAVIEGVPNSVAVSNAAPQVAAAARWHIGSVKEDAVASALVDIADATKTGSMPAFMR